MHAENQYNMSVAYSDTTRFAMFAKGKLLIIQIVKINGFNSPEPNAQLSISDRNLPFVRRRNRCSSHFCLLQNHWLGFNQT